MEKAKKEVKQFKLLERVEYSREGIVSSEVLRNSAGTLTVFAFDAGQGLSEHSAPFDAVVQILEGRATITIGGEPHEVSQGEMLIMPANVPHALSCVEPFKMVLAMFRGQWRGIIRRCLWPVKGDAHRRPGA